MRTHKLHPLAGAVAAAALLLTPGCVTTDSQEYEVAQQENLRRMEERNTKLLGTLEGMRLELDRLTREVEQLKAQQRANPAAQQMASLEQRTADLERRLQAAEAARARDKEEIVSTLSANMKRLLDSATRTPAPPPTRARPTKVTGREHKVEAGETVSAIAAAYGVRSSEILEANNITDATRIRVGQVLFIPEKK